MLNLRFDAIETEVTVKQVRRGLLSSKQNHNGKTGVIIATQQGESTKKWLHTVEFSDGKTAVFYSEELEFLNQ